MSLQLSTAVRNARLDAIEATIGTAPILRIRTGSVPATPATADAGTVLATLTLPSDWMSAASAGVKSLLGTWADNAADATGTAAHFRVYDSGGTVTHMQGTVGTNVQMPTSAATAANSNVLTFSATTGVVAGMNVSGTGIVAGTTVLATTSTTVTLSAASVAGVASGASITFAPDMTVDNTSFAAGQSFSITAFTITEANA